MKVVFLESAARDLQWFRHYYRTVFPEGGSKAGKHFKAMIQTLSANPYAGHPNDTWPDVRELSIPRTPFLLIYRVTRTQIEVLRLWATRQGADIDRQGNSAPPLPAAWPASGLRTRPWRSRVTP